MKTNNTGRIASIALLLVSISYCNKGGLPSISPEKVFQDTEKAIEATYFAGPDMPTPELSKLYGAALNAVEADQSAKPDRESVIKAINSAGPEKVRERTYKALGAFLSALPGTNDFARVEGVLLSEDKERQAGIGVLLMQEGPGRFLVLDTLEGSPATIGGIHPGYVLKTIDDRDVRDFDLEEVAGHIRGPEGSTVRLTFYGGNANIARSKINFINYSNNTWMKGDGSQVEIISLRTTLPGTAESLKKFVLQLGKRSAIILDLRKLQQGDYEECFKVADLFVGKQKMGNLIMKNTTKAMEADGDVLFTGPVYVILGKNSSPAADVLALAIRSSMEVNLVGSDRPGQAYFTDTIEIDGRLRLHLTKGVVADSQGIALPKRGVKVDVSVNDYLPQEPPASKPSEGDPAHKQLAQMIGLK